MTNYGIGNTFPMSLARRYCTITPIDKSVLDALSSGAILHSYWGHSNTIEAANAFLDINVTPPRERRALLLNSNKYPTLDGVVLDGIIVVSPTYVDGYRPAEGEISSPDKILGWELLFINFP